MSLSCLNYKVHKNAEWMLSPKKKTTQSLKKCLLSPETWWFFFSAHHFKEVTVNSCIREQLYFIKAGLHNIAMCSVKRGKWTQTCQTFCYRSSLFSWLIYRIYLSNLHNAVWLKGCVYMGVWCLWVRRRAQPAQRTTILLDECINQSTARFGCSIKFTPLQNHPHHSRKIS